MGSKNVDFPCIQALRRCRSNAQIEFESHALRKWMSASIPVNHWDLAKASELALRVARSNSTAWCLRVVDLLVFPSTRAHVGNGPKLALLR
jgi:hypothetical protein